MPEREREPQIPEVRPEVPEVSKRLEEETGMKAIETAFRARVKDKGRDLIQTSATQTITIQLPSTQRQLADWSKGSPASSLTWFAVFWLRMMKKALHFGWKITGGQIVKRKGEK